MIFLLVYLRRVYPPRPHYTFFVLVDSKANYLSTMSIGHN